MIQHKFIDLTCFEGGYWGGDCSLLVQEVPKGTKVIFEVV